MPKELRGRSVFRLRAFVRSSSKASGDHGLSGSCSGEGDGSSLRNSMSCKELMTSSIASRRGEGVRPGRGEGGAGDGPLETVGYRSFIEGAGEGPRAGWAVYAILCGGGTGGGGEEPLSS